jgi:magnesium-transporting ATPase (P-type)
VVNYNFYKNMVLVMPVLFYGSSMAFSGQPFYEQILYQLYNVVFTFWPGVFYAILDRPVKDLSDLENDEELYEPALAQKFFSYKVFVYWLTAGALQGCLLQFAAFHVFGTLGNSDELSSTDSIWLSGTGLFFWVVLGVNLTLFLRLALTVTVNVLVIAFSVLCFPTIVYLLDHVSGNRFLHGVALQLFGLGGWRFWLVTGFVVFIFLALGEPLIRSVTHGIVRPTPGLPKAYALMKPDDVETCCFTSPFVAIAHPIVRMEKRVPIVPNEDGEG